MKIDGAEPVVRSTFAQVDNRHGGATSDTCVLTLGHSNVPLAKLLDLLGKHGVQTVVDVRSMPYSRFVSQFNRETLDHALAEAGISYRFLGEPLGGRPSDPTCYWSGQVPMGKADYIGLVNYAEVARRDWFLRGLNRFLQLAQESTTAALCSEEDPARCHRHLLIARTLLARGVSVRHVRGSGEDEDAHQTEERIMRRENAEQLSFFDSRDMP